MHWCTYGLWEKAAFTWTTSSWGFIDLTWARRQRAGGPPPPPSPLLVAQAPAEAQPIQAPRWRPDQSDSPLGPTGRRVKAVQQNHGSRRASLGGARSILWTSGASQRPFSRADSIYSISVVRMILLTRPTSDLVKSLKQKTDRWYYSRPEEGITTVLVPKRCFC